MDCGFGTPKLVELVLAEFEIHEEPVRIPDPPELYSKIMWVGRRKRIEQPY